MKPALQATLRVFGLCGSFVVLVWVVLWFLVTCGFWLWSARPIVLMWFLWLGGLVSMPMPTVDRIDARPIHLMWFLRLGGLVSMPMRVHLLFANC